MESIFPFVIVTLFVFTILGIVIRYREDYNETLGSDNGDQIESYFDDLNESPKNKKSTKRTPANYECDNCGAGIEDGTDVSPSGDVKCNHCKNWFNIYSDT